MSSTVEQSIEVEVPLSTAYNQWTQFERFPRVAWRNVNGKENAGVVTFHRLDDARTRLMVQLDFVPEGIVEQVGSALGAPDRRVKGDLERFKDLIESAGSESGRWRGEVKRPDEA
jgi:uncharacterized membrane protein